ncbi:hemophore-related protein [Nocardia wallacei]|uniref:hemophore-related protein n=1 Tax=Nocardia wallacei TaxID=480035 RepID=UPI002453CE1B|nr:hemophore-related protein [Nocardia wallacei]
MALLNRRSAWALLAGGLVAAGLAVTPTPAWSDPGRDHHALADTTCSYQQIRAAMQQHAPEFAEHLDRSPDHRAHLEQILSKSPDQRRHDPQARDRGKDRFDELRKDPRFGDLPTRLQAVRDSCHQF